VQYGKDLTAAWSAYFSNLNEENKNTPTCIFDTVFLLRLVADIKVLLLTYNALHGSAPTDVSDLVLLYIPTVPVKRLGHTYSLKGFSLFFFTIFYIV
jgi:hypothetical protein